MHKILVWKEFYFMEILILLGLNGLKIKIKHYFSKEKVVMLIFSFLITNRQFLLQLFFHFSLNSDCLLPLLLVYYSIVLNVVLQLELKVIAILFFLVFGKKRLFTIYFFLSLLICYNSMFLWWKRNEHFSIFTFVILQRHWPWRNGMAMTVILFLMFARTQLFVYIYTQTLI